MRPRGDASCVRRAHDRRCRDFGMVWSSPVLKIADGLTVTLTYRRSWAASPRHTAAWPRACATFQNSGSALSIGVFFSLMIAGLARSLPTTLTNGLQQQGVPHAIARHIGRLPPVSSLFAALLGVNPIRHLLAPGGALSALPRPISVSSPAGHSSRS